MSAAETPLPQVRDTARALLSDFPAVWCKVATIARSNAWDLTTAQIVKRTETQ